MLCRIIDLWVSKCSTNAHFAGSNSVVIDGGVESSGWVECDFINSVNDDASGTGYALTIRDTDYSTQPPRFNNFQQCFFDSHAYGLVATAGKDISFIGCWFSCRPGDGALLNDADCENYSFIACRFENCGRHGLWINTGTDYLVKGCSSISNNQQAGGGYGIAFTGISGIVDKERLFQDMERTGPRWARVAQEVDEVCPTLWERHDWQYRGYVAQMEDLILEYAVKTTW